MAPTTPTILIVDDEPALADVYGRLLDDEFTVRIAYSGESGLAKFDHDVDLVLLDRRMPDLSGDEVLDRLRDHDHECPVAMITAVEPDIDIVDLPFDEYVTKPVDREELVTTVNRLLAQTGSERSEDVLNALGDQKARQILSYIVANPATADEIERATEYSQATVYRRLNTLKQAGIIEAETKIGPNGNHYKTFHSTVTRISIDISANFDIRMERVSGEIPE